jgi:hypothetical protein
VDLRRYSFIRVTGLSLRLDITVRCINDTGIKDINLRRNLSLINAIVQCLYHLNNGVPCLEVQRFPSVVRTVRIKVRITRFFLYVKEPQGWRYWWPARVPLLRRANKETSLA